MKKHVPVRIEEEGAIEASVAVVLSPDGDVLLIRRAEHPDDPWSGHIALPGGRRDPDDADRLATAVRETLEETGLELDRRWVIGELDDLHPRTPYLPPIVIRPFVFAAPAAAATTCSAEVVECLWTPLRDLAVSAAPATVRVRERDVEVPAYRAGGRIVWGLTHRILSQLLELSGLAVPPGSASRNSP